MGQFTADKIRNVAFIGHSGEGKTTLAEACLFTCKAIDRQGKVDDGSSTMDFDPEEISRKISISLSTAYVEYKGVKVNILDVPGFFDFEGEHVQAMSSSEGCLIVTSANGSLSVGTEKNLDYCKENGKPAMLFINQVDKENANPKATFDVIANKYGSYICPIQLPIMEGAKTVGIVDVLDNKAYMFNGGASDIPANLQGETKQAKDKLIEAVAETDEELMNKFFEGTEFAPEELTKGIKNAIIQGVIVPVLYGSALNNKGTEQLLDKIVAYMPQANEGKPAKGINDKNENVELKVEDGPVVAFCFKTIADPFVGRLSLMKVRRGTLKGGIELLNSTQDKKERIPGVFLLKGKKQEPCDQVTAGDICAIAKLQNTYTGDTLCDPSNYIKLDSLAFPKPCISLAVTSAKQGDEEKVFQNLYKLQDEDATFKVEKNVETSEMLLAGLGETHIDVLVKKLKNKFGCEAKLSDPTIAYRETIKKKAEAEGKHKKQSGGAGQFGVANIRFEPGAADGQFEFVDEVVGGAVPRQFIPAVEKGLREAIKKGVLAGYPMVNLKCTLFDGKYHPVDSKEVAFVSAAKLAYDEGCRNASPCILEPIYTACITVPESYMGDILGDMNKRRGRILGMEAKNGKQVITSEVPMSEMFKYATDLRSMTQGRGSFTMEFARYEEVPAGNVPKIIEEAKKRAEEKENR